MSFATTYTLRKLEGLLIILDRVSPVNNRPSTDLLLHHIALILKHVTHDIQHVTRDIGHMTFDM